MQLLNNRLITAAYAHMLLQRQVFNMTHTPRWGSKLPCYCGLVFSASATETSRHVRRLLNAALAGDGYVMRNMQGRDSERWSGCCERGPWTRRACCLQLRSMWFTVYKGPAGGFVMDGEAVWRPWRCVFVSPLSLLMVPFLLLSSVWTYVLIMSHFSQITKSLAASSSEISVTWMQFVALLSNRAAACQRKCGLGSSV